MTNEKRPRTWWINSFSRYLFKDQDEPGDILKLDPQIIQVVEGGAYEQAIARAEAAESELRSLIEVGKMSHEADKYMQAQLAQAIAERDRLKKGLGMAVEAFREMFPAGLGFSGDAILHLLWQLHNGEVPTSWRDEVMKMIEENDPEFKKEST